MLAACLLAGCHRDAADAAPPAARAISPADRFYDVAALDARTAVVVGDAGRVLRTGDGGATWTSVPSGVTTALYAVDFPDARHGWISGQSGTLLHSADGGRSWQPQASPTPAHLFALDMLDADEGWAVGDRATALHTRDGGRTWRAGTVAATGLPAAGGPLVAEAPVLYGVQFADARHGWVVGEFGTIHHTADGGQSWVPQQESLVGEGFYDALDIPTFFGVHFSDARHGIATALAGRIARTRDGGRTWAYETIDAATPLVEPLLQPVQLPDGTAWAVGVGGEVVRQPAPGAPWQRAALGIEARTWLRGIDWADARHGWIVGGDGLILHTSDGGAAWTRALG